MRSRRHPRRAAAGRAARVQLRRVSETVAAALVLLVLLVLTGCSAGIPQGGSAEPPTSVSPSPDYPNACAPLGADTSVLCVRITLEAIDSARAQEGLPPMVLPADFTDLSIPEQAFVAVDRERVDRGLPPFARLSETLDQTARTGAQRAQLPPPPPRGYTSVASEWIGGVDNGLDADFQWLYHDGPHSGVPGCSGNRTSGCWADREIVLAKLGSRHLVMGASFDATADTSRHDRGGTSLAAIVAVGPPHPASSTYTWADALAATSVGRLQPLRSVPASMSATGIHDPVHNVAPVPDFTRICHNGGIDDSAACLGAALAAINHAHALEGVPPMVLPSGFARLSVPEQLFVAVNLERVERGLPPFTGLTTALNLNAQRGANDAKDPPDPGRHYLLDDAEWAGGSSNGLDAVYGWMYDDGFASGNLDCRHTGGAGCWGHRKGILDDFGSGAHLVMGAASNVRGDTHRGDRGGTSMAVTLAVDSTLPRSLVSSWAQVLASMPSGALGPPQQASSALSIPRRHGDGT